ncbi:probable transcriptional regulator [Roseobacter sp. SK209-2-6]|uniref:GntR family transcriptional regulator n=1 Tax=Roseobacter sp. SK209-2-6 TaxID=388739 RepID=UPI0000F3CE90|nr:GntR family transcriptional regulator [Roseobacter sp. SK209-2-6]EBA16003.1 probable transcriptional regulator [Roseobacter sp. SK209-2-6]
MKLKSVDISKTASASSIVFEALRRAIIEGDLTEGEPLRQDEIARLFNTSRIPVREAISRLEEHGLVKTQRYKGAVVSGLSVTEAEEIFDFRALVEPEVIRRAVPQMSQETLAQARDSWAAFSEADDPMTWGELNRDFHSVLYQASGLQYHLDIIDNAMDRIDRYLRAQLVLSNGMERANEEHMGIWQACMDGNAELAAERTRQHITGARESLLQNLSNLR